MRFHSLKADSSVRVVRSAIATWLLIGVALGRAETVNIDIGVSGGIPTNTYGAAGIAGVWNGIPAPFGQLNITAPGLLDVSGAATDISLTIDRTSADGETTGWGNVDRYPSMDAYQLLHDQINTFIWYPFHQPYGAVFDFSGIDPGRYDIITYTTPTAVTNVQSIVTINNDPATGQQVNGTFHYASFNELSEGVTHVVHRNVPVEANGALRVLAHSTLQSDMSFVNGLQLMPTTSFCNFDNDTDCDAADIDALVAAVVSESRAPQFDLTGDGLVDRRDILHPTAGWLRLAGEERLGPGLSYLEGDANLDGRVNAQDFFAWHQNRFTNSARWSAGDWNADGIVNGADFMIWNRNKFARSDMTPVPEPSRDLLWWVMTSLLALRSPLMSRNLIL